MLFLRPDLSILYNWWHPSGKPLLHHASNCGSSTLPNIEIKVVLKYPFIGFSIWSSHRSDKVEVLISKLSSPLGVNKNFKKMSSRDLTLNLWIDCSAIHEISFRLMTSIHWKWLGTNTAYYLSVNRFTPTPKLLYSKLKTGILTDCHWNFFPKFNTARLDSEGNSTLNTESSE